MFPWHVVDPLWFFRSSFRFETPWENSKLRMLRTSFSDFQVFDNFLFSLVRFRLFLTNYKLTAHVLVSLPIFSFNPYAAIPEWTLPAAWHNKASPAQLCLGLGAQKHIWTGTNSTVYGTCHSLTVGVFCHNSFSRTPSLDLNKPCEQINIQIQMIC
jgi:hypothetical protein